MKLRISFYILFLFFTFNVFSKSVKITIPKYGKMMIEGYDEYEMTLDSDDRISSIKKVGNDDYKIEANYDSSEVYLKIYRKGKEKQIVLSDVNNNYHFSTNSNNFFTVENIERDFRLSYKNGILLSFEIKNSYFDYRFDFFENNNSYEIQFNEQAWGKPINNYDLWNEAITVESNIFSRNTKYSKQNFIILNIFSSYLAKILFPQIFDLDTSYSFNSYQSDSELKEGSTCYVAENLRNIKGNPWASKNGYGIGDKIKINIDVRNNLFLQFYNGFQSSEKPYLYGENSRAKKISISCLETGIRKEFELQDSKECQIIALDPILQNMGENVNLQIEILDVYPGTKYKDLCIQAIIPEIKL